MSIRPWYETLADIEDGSLYFHGEMVQSGVLKGWPAHKHWQRPYVADGEATPPWCGCGERMHWLDPRKLHPLTARAAAELQIARAVYALQEEDESRSAYIAEGADLDRLALNAYGLVRTEGESDAALRARIEWRLRP